MRVLAMAQFWWHYLNYQLGYDPDGDLCVQILFWSALNDDF